MALGKAFIEVHADTKPFARELGPELEKIVNAAGQNVKVSARKIGESVSEEAGKGIREKKSNVNKGLEDAVSGSTGIFAKVAKGIVDTIDDGLSGLPAEAKIILGLTLLALLPIAVAMGAALAAAIVTGLTVGGLAVLGGLLAAQFVEVREQFETVFGNLRNQFLNAARFLARPFINAINLVNQRFGELGIQMHLVFERAGRIIVPLVDSVLGALEQFLPAFNRGLRNIGDFMAPLQVGMRLIGAAAGDFFETILTHENAPEAFYDMLLVVEDLFELFTLLVDIGLDFWGVIRDIAEFLGLTANYSDEMEGLSKDFGIAGDTAHLLGDAIEGTTVALDSENKAIEEHNRLLTELVAAQFDVINNQIDFEQGIDDLSASLKKNKDTLDLHNQAGRDNARVLLDLASTIRTTRDDTIALTGDVAAAEVTFASQRAELERVAAKFKLSKTEVDSLIGSILEIPPLKPAGITAGSLTRLEQFNEALRDAIELQRIIGPPVNPYAPGGQQKYADGGIVTGPTNALIGEAGAEAVIPLTKPARAAQLLNDSGLSSLMAPSVNVYIGNEQIDAYIDNRVVDRMAVTARSLAYGGRGI